MLAQHVPVLERRLLVRLGASLGLAVLGQVPESPLLDLAPSAALQLLALESLLLLGLVPLDPRVPLQAVMSASPPQARLQVLISQTFSTSWILVSIQTLMALRLLVAIKPPSKSFFRPFGLYPNGDQGIDIGGSVNEPLDASKHRPSQFQDVQGDPTIEHDNPEHSTIGRHGTNQGNATDAYGSGVH